MLSGWVKVGHVMLSKFRPRFRLRSTFWRKVEPSVEHSIIQIHRKKSKVLAGGHSNSRLWRVEKEFRQHLKYLRERKKGKGFVPVWFFMQYPVNWRAAEPKSSLLVIFNLQAALAERILRGWATWEGLERGMPAITKLKTSSQPVCLYYPSHRFSLYGNEFSDRKQNKIP